MIVSSGYNIGGPEVESAVNQHPDVARVRGGRPARPRAGLGRLRLRRAGAGVVGDAAKVREIQDFVKPQIAPYKYPREVRFVDALPRNPSGKLQHFDAQQFDEAEQLRQQFSQEGQS